MSTARGERLAHLHASRRALYTLPIDLSLELPGRGNVFYAIRDYSKDKTKGAAEARSDISFLFKVWC